jgi:YggT family protein
VTGILAILIEVLFWIIIADCILSYIIPVQRPRWASHPIVRLIQEISFQVLRPFRRFLDRVGLRTSPIDFSPLIACFAIQILGGLLINFLRSIGIP